MIWRLILWLLIMYMLHSICRVFISILLRKWRGETVWKWCRIPILIGGIPSIIGGVLVRERASVMIRVMLLRTAPSVVRICVGRS